MQFVLALILMSANVAAAMAHAQVGVPWRDTPRIVVISASGDDSRLVLVDEAVSFWNKTLEEIDSAFRLGPVTRVAQAIPEDALQSLSQSVLANPRGPVDIPQPLRDLPGDLTILLGDSGFVSFAIGLGANPKRIVGIRGANFPPLSLPNVARNLIAHELGHAIGLGHNSDPTYLMCGRPAPCRPDIYQSDKPRQFPLTDSEKRQLLTMYPREWKPQSP